MNVLKLASAAAAAATLTLAATPTFAATVYDAVKDFSFTEATGVNGVWSYGYFNGSAFVPYNVVTPVGAGGYSWTSSTWAPHGVPAVVGNEGDEGPIVYATVTQGTDVLNVHPGGSLTSGTGGTDYDSIVRFTAPVTSTYSYAGFFRVLDTKEPNGVNVSVGGDTPTLLTGSFGSQSNFSGLVSLSAGSTFDFRVNRAGDYSYDSTGLSASITAVPEPATWAMMIIGFGAAGSMIRRRRAVVA